MSYLKSRVGPWKFIWKTTPKGREGSAQVEFSSGEIIDVRWKRDDHGVWISFPRGVYGFDFQGQMDESGERNYLVSQRIHHAEWSGVSSFQGSELVQAAVSSAKAKSTRVRAQMPGKILRVLVQEGQVVEKDQSLAVMEAMKMENEIRSPHLGKVKQVKIVEGQAVETGSDLILLEPV